jgi:hypothetical protein
MKGKMQSLASMKDKLVAWAFELIAKALSRPAIVAAK